MSSDSAAAGAITDDASAVVHPYLVRLIQTSIRDEVEDVEERLHRDITTMHVDMLTRIDALQVDNNNHNNNDDANKNKSPRISTP